MATAFDERDRVKNADRAGALDTARIALEGDTLRFSNGHIGVTYGIS